MSTEQKREALKKRYPGSTKVAKLSEAQVHAMYNRLLSKGDL